MSYPTAKGSFYSQFFGFPLLVRVERKSPQSCNYANVEFYFDEGYAPNGCQMYKVAEVIEKLFEVNTRIVPKDGINKTICFKYCIPYYVTNSNKEMDDRVCDGIALTLCQMIKNGKQY